MQLRKASRPGRDRTANTVNGTCSSRKLGLGEYLDDILLRLGEYVHSDQDGRQNDCCTQNAADCDDHTLLGITW